ncbi:MAG: hypothetical protein IKN91_06000 [Paludibacteraceae bacterium]|nr:hypothetical protein [Paludibacteraceae bacterium]
MRLTFVNTTTLTRCRDDAETMPTTTSAQNEQLNLKKVDTITEIES